jgi:hypothetical protein
MHAPTPNSAERLTIRVVSFWWQIPLCEKDNVRSVLNAVDRASKPGRARGSDQLPTPRDVSRIQAAIQQAIQTELEAEGLIRLCDSVIEAGNKAFRGIYEKVWCKFPGLEPHYINSIVEYSKR